MSYTLEQATAKVAEDQGWQRRLSPQDLEEAWRNFVSECVRGYTMSIYEYENDRHVRTMIYDVMTDPDLRRDPPTEEFEERISQTDDRFRQLLQPGVLIGDASNHWWERGVPRYAGAELASDFQEIYGVNVETA
jgi:hypothetical protein